MHPDLNAIYTLFENLYLRGHNVADNTSYTREKIESKPKPGPSSTKSHSSY